MYLIRISCIYAYFPDLVSLIFKRLLYYIIMADSLIFISIMFITLLACDWISNLAGSMRNCVPVIPSCKLTKSTPPPPRICQAFLSPRYSANKAAEQSIDCSGTIFDGFGDSALKRVVRAFLADVDFGSTLRSQHSTLPKPECPKCLN